MEKKLLKIQSEPWIIAEVEAVEDAVKETAAEEEMIEEKIEEEIETIAEDVAKKIIEMDKRRLPNKSVALGKNCKD